MYFAGMKPAGYSKTTLARKLGIKNGQVIRFINLPEHYFELFDDFPENVDVTKSKSMRKDLIHLFVPNERTMFKTLPGLKEEIKEAGCIWVSWPKKSSHLYKDLTEDKIRNLAVELGLVDIKVCAVDENWSALKLVIPIKSRISGK